MSVRLDEIAVENRTEGLRDTIKIRDKVLSNETPPYIIAEMACAHDGNINKAKLLIDSAVQAGADAIQFEIVDPDDNIIPDSDIYTLLKRLYFTPEQWHEIFRYARSYDIAIFSYAYDYVSLCRALECGSDALKLNSSDLSNPDMIIGCAESGFPFTLGTGASTVAEIAQAIKLSLDHSGNQIILMHGIQNFPTTLANERIGRIPLLRDTFQALVGYANHTEGSHPLSKYIDFIALGMGAVVIEKHITLDRSEKGIDYQSALEPHEFKEFVTVLRESYTTIGTKDISVLNESDKQYRQFQKKWIVAACTLPKGTNITREKVKFLRSPSLLGISPMDIADIVDKKTTRTIEQYETITGEDIQ